MHCDVDMEVNKKSWTRELHRKELNEEFYFAVIIGFNGDKLIAQAKKCRTSDISNDSITNLCNDFGMCDDNGDALPLPIPLDENIRKCKMISAASGISVYRRHWKT